MINYWLGFNQTHLKVVFITNIMISVQSAQTYIHKGSSENKTKCNKLESSVDAIAISKIWNHHWLLHQFRNRAASKMNVTGFIKFQCPLGVRTPLCNQIKWQREAELRKDQHNKSLKYVFFLLSEFDKDIWIFENIGKWI